MQAIHSKYGRGITGGFPRQQQILYKHFIGFYKIAGKGVLI